MIDIENIRTRLDNNLVDTEDVITALLSVVEDLSDMTEGQDIVSCEAITELILDNLEDYLTEPKTCVFETARETLETPAETCEDFAIEGSDYCKYHD